MDEKRSTTEGGPEVHTGRAAAPRGDEPDDGDQIVGPMESGVPGNEPPWAQLAEASDPDEADVRPVEYADEDGRRFRTAIPDDAPDSHADMGVPIGPPDLTGLQLPEDFSVQLQNALLDRGIVTYQDFRRKPMVVRGALNHVLRASIRQMETIYREW